MRHIYKTLCYSPWVREKIWILRLGFIEIVYGLWTSHLSYLEAWCSAGVYEGYVMISIISSSLSSHCSLSILCTFGVGLCTLSVALLIFVSFTYLLPTYVLFIELLVERVWATIWDFFSYRWHAHSVYVYALFSTLLNILWYLLLTSGWY